MPDEILQRLPKLAREAGALRERMLANLVMLGEVPAPTFGEGARIALFRRRLSHNGLQSCSVDEVGNGQCVLSGQDGRRSILVSAHADTPFAADVDHTLTVQPDRVTGPGVADNSLGLAVVTTLPAILEHLGIRLRSDLVLMAETRSLGEAALEGLRFFLSHQRLHLAGAVCVEGAQLGRLNHVSMAALGGEIRCRTDEDGDCVEGCAPGAISVLGGIVSELSRLTFPRGPRTRLVLGEIEGGTRFDKTAHSASLRFELRSDSDELLGEVGTRIQELLAEVRRRTGADVDFAVIGRSESGGLPPEHPLVVRAREVMETLGIEPRPSPLSSAVSACTRYEVPAVKIGISTASDLGEAEESVEIEPMARGIAQLLGVLMSIDEGLDG